METNKDFKCSKCDYETGSLVSLEWHVTSECPNMELKVENKFIKNLFVSLVCMFVITYTIIGWILLFYGHDVISVKYILLFYFISSFILTLLLD